MVEKEKKIGKEEEKSEKGIVRIVGFDIDASLSVINGLRRIKGISFMFANATCKKLGINPRMRIGDLSEEKIKEIENFIKNPKGIPSWILNRRKDLTTGKDFHLVGGDLDLKVKEDIEFLKKIRAYRGVRHEMGLPVRGQRTGGKSFRKGKTIGVVRKKELPQAAKKEKGEKR
ncbi:MAG: 30S ribosomal protein S13 [Candidatus Aenigmatarchaeota archaeon]|nr:30S ribosomal protein S13 [Candidatus Aenigmarchaeota archaeon]